MKTISALLFVLISSAYAGNNLGFYNGTPVQSGPSPEQLAVRSANQQKMNQLNADEQLRIQIQNFVPKDPWRIIDGTTNYAKGGDWVQFVGQVVQVHPKGVRVKGGYGSPLLLENSSEFILVNFPYPAADGEEFALNDHWSAMFSGTISFSITTNIAETLRALDYGKPCDTPAWVVAAIKAKNDQKKQDMAISTFTFRKQKADKGDAEYQFLTGECFRTGYGVGMDLNQAREWYRKAAAQDHAKAKAALEKLALEK